MNQNAAISCNCIFENCELNKAFFKSLKNNVISLKFGNFFQLNIEFEFKKMKEILFIQVFLIN